MADMSSLDNHKLKIFQLMIMKTNWDVSSPNTDHKLQLMTGIMRLFQDHQHTQQYTGLHFPSQLSLCPPSFQTNAKHNAISDTDSVCRFGPVRFFDPKTGNRLPNSEISKNWDRNQFFSVSVITSKNRSKLVF